ncbi:MAG: hypothetical protein ACYDA2_04860 [Acidimicrobiales bacterium]
MSVAGSLLGDTVGVALQAAGRWVADGAVWLLGQVGHAMTATTSVDLGASWFTEHERVMAVLGASVVLPMLCCTAVLAVYRQDASTLVRAFFVHLPLAMLLTGVALTLVRMGLAITDQLSARVLAAGGADTAHLLSPVAAVLAASALPSGGAVPAFAVLVASLLVAFASFALWLELVVRSAAITAAALFLPLVLAALVWPAVSHWCRRLADTIAALVLSKLVVAAVLSLAAGAVLGGARAGASGDVAAGFADVVTGTALLLIATVAPFLLLRLVPAVEAGAVMHLEGARHRLRAVATAPLRAGSFALDTARDAGLAAATAGATGGLDPTPGAAPGSGIPYLRGMPAEEATAMTGLYFDPADYGPNRRRQDDDEPGR